MMTHCPGCGADFQGKPIPEAHRELFGDKTHFTRLIGVYDIERDRTTHYKCPDCDRRITREEAGRV